MLYSIFRENLKQLIPSSQYSQFAVAFSGGVDSTALLSLAQQYSKEHEIELHAVIVDHQLRKESAQESLNAAKLCLDFGVTKHCILTWQHEGIESNIQALARDARYTLISEYCRKHKIDILLTGHHADDNVENFFIKLYRGSGIKGLLQHSVSHIYGITIVRPLFNITKDKLQNYLSSRNIGWIEDESNKSMKYFRNEIRSHIDTFLKYYHIDKTLFKQRLMTTQKNLQSVYDVFTDVVEKAWSKHVMIFDDHAIIDDVASIKYAAVYFDILDRVLNIIGNKNKIKINNIRGSSISRIIDLIQDQQDFTRTLHQCIIKKSNNKIFIYHELKNICNKEYVTNYK